MFRPLLTSFVRLAAAAIPGATQAAHVPPVRIGVLPDEPYADSAGAGFVLAEMAVRDLGATEFLVEGEPERLPVEPLETLGFA